MRIPAIEVGHECYPVPNVPAGVQAGSNATFQIMYRSDEHGTTEDETFYACPDFTYAPTSRFTDQVPSFNVAKFTAVPTAASAGSIATTGAATSSMATEKRCEKAYLWSIWWCHRRHGGWFGCCSTNWGHLAVWIQETATEVQVDALERVGP
ncbi:uncharacterized protein Aud_009370 [Aspergillus udagawae]|uniref:Copper acquisition factor BIM1-like domain-containing protein n=1 Tax=Aspergillus udagawae TaxID=91492 RepID=A0A8E0V598_9EURO|nr:uncharacterized protein Aud_009370 [Aspergillus udagawae]GIC92894.1 hypothetical protein Aud_009370 [Aspergillus udagawae]